MEQESGKKLIGITLKISVKANELLNVSCKNSRRTKRAEATLRLEDHLFCYPSIAVISKDEELINES